MWEKLLLLLNHPDVSLETKLEVKRYLHFLSSPGGMNGVGELVSKFLETQKEFLSNEG